MRNTNQAMHWVPMAVEEGEEMIKLQNGEELDSVDVGVWTITRRDDRGRAVSVVTVRETGPGAPSEYWCDACWTLIPSGCCGHVKAVQRYLLAECGL